MTTCGELLVQLLDEYGIDTIFGIPGVHTVELYRGLGDGAPIRHVTPRHEQGAGFMADGYARATGKVAACFIITGPGMTNIATAMGQAYGDSIPMLVISSTNKSNQLQSGDGRLHELYSQRNLISGVAAFSHTLMSPDELPQVLARAFAVFQSARPRPVHIEIPIDVITQSADHVPLKTAPVFSRPAPTAAAVAAAATLLKGAVSPLLLFGGGSIDGAREAQRLAEFLDAPVALTNNAKGILPPGHPLSVGNNQSLPAVRELAFDADVVLAVGTELGETDYDLVFDGGFKLGGKLIRVDVDAEQLVRNFLPDVAILSDSQQFLQALCAELSIGETSPLTDSPAALRVAEIMAKLDSDRDLAYRSQDRFLRALQAKLPGVIVVGDSTQPVYTGQLSYEAEQTRTWFHSGTGYGTLGYALPAAIGAKLGQPERPVVALVGDGGLQFTLPELASAVESGTSIIVLLWNNRCYGEIKKYMRNNGIPEVGVDIYTPDFQGIARSMGCRSCHLESYETMEAILQEAGEYPVPTIVEIDESASFLYDGLE
ncbi:MAG: acetolactate synthase-1/2/3 large subunit [Halieaceae bacterium]|jgi:acetolactate synthase-1/2/3 large subunit